MTKFQYVSLGNTVATQTLNPPMVKPFRLTCLAKGGGGGGVATPLQKS